MYSALQYSTVITHNVMYCNLYSCTVQYSTVLYSTVVTQNVMCCNLCSCTMQYSIALHCTVSAPYVSLEAKIPFASIFESLMLIYLCDFLSAVTLVLS